MFALECAAYLTRRLNLVYEPIGSADRQALSEALQRDGHDRCPEATREAVAADVERLLRDSRGRREDDLLAVWAVAREEVFQHASAAQRLWLVQLARRTLPREGIEALLEIDRDAMLELVGSAEVVRETRRQRDLGLCDNHLHSGAADELGELLGRLVPRVVDINEPRKLAEAVGVGVDGASLNTGPIVLGLAAACTLLDAPDGPSTAAEALLADRHWWQMMHDAATASTRCDDSTFTVLRNPIRDTAVARGVAPQLSVLYQALADVAEARRLSPDRLEAARRGLVSLAVLHNLIAIPHDSRLGTFVDRFRLMRSVRSLFGGDGGRLTSALLSMYREGGVAMVELRKSIVVSPARTVSVEGVRSSIRASIAEHANSAIVACERLGIDDLVVRMPLTFTRRDGEEVDVAAEVHDYVPFRAPVGETLAVADAIVQETQADAVRRFVGAVDVVGDEKKVPNWLYALAYQRIARASELEFACHAGEYFADRTEGLRRIAEVALFAPAAVRRIGHGLALGSELGAETQRTDETGTLLENAIWSLLVLGGRREAQLGQAGPVADVPATLVRDLKRVMLQLAVAVFGTSQVGVEDAMRWYVARFDTAAMERWIPGLELAPTATDDWPRGMSRTLLPRATDLVDAMLAATVHEMVVEVRDDVGVHRVRYDPAARVSADVLRRARTLMEQARRHLRQPVLDWLVSSEIVIESCPSSNAALARLSLAQHPIWRFHQEELLCSVNTDDPALFGASLTEEYVHVGMVAHADGGDGESFVAELADRSRSVGVIREQLCDDAERPLEVYRALSALR